MNQLQNTGTKTYLSLYDEISRYSDKLNLLLKGTDISAERFIYAFQSEWNRNPKLQNCNRDSLTQTIMRCAEMGLLPGIGAYIIPYDKYNGAQVTDTTAQMQVSLQGWLTLLWRSGNVENITNNLYRKGDEFSYCIEHMGIKFSHKPKLEMNGDILGAYAMITLKNHQVQFKYCNLQEINASKEASKSKKPDSPWIKNFDQMAKIVPLRKLARLIAPSLHAWHSEEPSLFYHPEPASQMLEISPSPIMEAEIKKANNNQIDTIRSMCNNDQITTILNWAHIETLHNLSETQAAQTIARLHQMKHAEIESDKITSEQIIKLESIIDNSTENETLYGNIAIPKTDFKNETFNERIQA